MSTCRAERGPCHCTTPGRCERLNADLPGHLWDYCRTHPGMRARLALALAQPAPGGPPVMHAPAAAEVPPARRPAAAAVAEGPLPNRTGLCAHLGGVVSNTDAAGNRVACDRRWLYTCLAGRPDCRPAHDCGPGRCPSYEAD